MIALIVALGQRTRSTVSYEGISVAEWAAKFYPNFSRGSTNEAVLAFQTMGSNAVPALQKMLRTKETWYARVYIRQATNLPSGTRKYLGARIKYGQAGLRRVAAARALDVLGTNATAAVPDLVVALADSDARLAAAQALTSIGGPGIAALAAATTNKDATVRHAAVYGLGQAGTNAWPATEALIDGVRGTDPQVRAMALYSLSRIGRFGVPTVLEAFSSYDPTRRAAAIEAIGAMNTPPRQVFLILLEFSTNASPVLRANSLEALQTLRLTHPRVLGAFFKAVDDPDPGVRATAARTLGQTSIWVTNSGLGEITMRLLGRTGTLDTNALAVLNAMLDDPDSSVRTVARQTLASLQPSNSN